MLFRYAFSFDEALKDAVTAKPAQRQPDISALTMRSDARKAHPSLDHLLPILAGAGTAGSNLGEQLWTVLEGNLCCAQYRFDKVTAM